MAMGIGGVIRLPRSEAARGRRPDAGRVETPLDSEEEDD